MLNYKIFNFSKNLLKLSSIIITLVSFICCSDMMNNYSIKDILTNTVPPAYTSMMINNNDSYTYSRNATVQLNVTDAAQMQFSDDSGTTWTSWEPYSNSKSWKLKLGTSTKIVQGRFRKSDTSIISLSDDIVFCERLIASDGVINKISDFRKEGYGSSLSLSSDGKILAAGHEADMLGLGHYTGSVYIYTWNTVTETWSESKITAADINTCSSFGRNVTLSADGITLAVSDPNNTEYSGGAVYIFKWNGAAWNQIQKIGFTINSIHRAEYLPVALSGNGNSLVIGNNRDNWHTNPPATNVHYDGAIYIYDYNSINYNGNKHIPITGDLNNGIGVSISQDGNTIISTPHITFQTMFIYRRNGLNWDATEYHASALDAMFTFTPKISSDGSIVLTGGESFIRNISWDGSNWNHASLYPSDENLVHHYRKISSNNSCTKFVATEEYYSDFHLFNYNGSSWTSKKYESPDGNSDDRFPNTSAMSDTLVFAVSNSHHLRADGEYIGEIFIYRE